MSTSIRSHRKTRDGCKRCKARRIKCDESKPWCRNCLKHSVRCDFMSSGASFSAPASPCQFATNPASPSIDTLSFGEAPAHRVQEHISQDPNNLMELNIIDLELLHNFSTSTCYTISSNPSIKTLWRVTVPRVSFTSNIVMRSILAVSALHLATFNPEKRDFYASQAMLQHQAASRAVAAILSKVTPENCTELYIFSALTSVFALATPRNPNNLLLFGSTGVAEWLYLLRGIRSIAILSRETLSTGCLSPMFSNGERRAQLRNCSQSNEDHNLDELQLQLNETVTDLTVLQVYTDATSELQKSYAVAQACTSQTYELTDAFIWAFRVSDQYLTLLKGHNQKALAIAHFCVLLKKHDAQWFMAGWSIHLIERIFYLLDEEHRLWIRWPIEEIGWIPCQSSRASY